MEHNQLDILSLILNAGIVVKFVILLLVGFSIYTWAIVLMKFSFHKKIKTENDGFKKEFDSYENIFDINIDDLNSHSLNGRILLSTLEELNKIEQMKSSGGEFVNREGAGMSTIERSIENSISECSFSIRKFNSTLASISSIAPFVGLFGTVWGIINSFQGLAGGGGSIQAVAPGIAEALVATAIGLAAAIPANWFFNKFTSEAALFEQRLVNFGKEIINLIERSN